MLSTCRTKADQKSEADQMVKSLHTAIQKHHWDAAAKLFDPNYFKQYPKDVWIKQFNNALQELGEIKSFNLSSQQKDPRFGGDFYIYIITITHTHGISHETITLLKPINGDPMLITGYQFKAKTH